MLIAIAAVLLTAGTDSVTLTTAPRVVRVTTQASQQLNFDFVVTNATVDSLTLRSIEVIVRDADGRFVQRHVVQGPALATVAPSRTVAPRSRGSIFNPFHTFDRAVPLASLDYVLRFARGERDSVTRRAHVVPMQEAPQTTGRLPIGGRVLVDDGHDFYSHHRRLDLTAGFAATFGVSRNFGRYALDLLPVDDRGDRYRGSGARLDDWYGYGREVMAIAAGRVVAVHDGKPNNGAAWTQDRVEMSALRADPMLVYGNYVLIRHAPQEFTLAGHLAPGSVRVRPGDIVRQGTVIGAIGSSGSSLYPHLHLELRDATTLDADGLPLSFIDVRRGGSGVCEATWLADTGDVLVPCTRDGRASPRSPASRARR